MSEIANEVPRNIRDNVSDQNPRWTMSRNIFNSIISSIRKKFTSRNVKRGYNRILTYGLTFNCLAYSSLNYIIANPGKIINHPFASSFTIFLDSLLYFIIGSIISGFSPHATGELLMNGILLFVNIRLFKTIRY